MSTVHFNIPKNTDAEDTLKFMLIRGDTLDELTQALNSVEGEFVIVHITQDKEKHYALLDFRVNSPFHFLFDEEEGIFDPPVAPKPPVSSA